MVYPEFGKYKKIIDPIQPLCNAYEDEKGHRVYVEPGFYDGMLGFKEKRHEDYERILDAIYDCVEENPCVILTADFENPWIHKEGYIYREILDFTDPLGIFVEDKSRGSDYGD